MFNIEIQKGDEWKWKDIITISPGQKSASLVHKTKVFDKKIEPVRKNISVSDYNDILDSLNSISIDQVFKENAEIDGLDGWTLSCNISNGVVHKEIAIWSPEKKTSLPETTKFLEICDKIFSYTED